VNDLVFVGGCAAGLLIMLGAVQFDRDTGISAKQVDIKAPQPVEGDRNAVFRKRHRGDASPQCLHARADGPVKQGLLALAALFAD
jgi:hypothetical protein